MGDRYPSQIYRGDYVSDFVPRYELDALRGTLTRHGFGWHVFSRADIAERDSDA